MSIKHKGKKTQAWYLKSHSVNTKHRRLTLYLESLIGKPFFLFAETLWTIIGLNQERVQLADDDRVLGFAKEK